MPRIISDELYAKFVDYGEIENDCHHPDYEGPVYPMLNRMLTDLVRFARPVRVAMFGSESGYVEDDNA